MDPFQPAARAPAPPPLDLVQDFVNTEIPEWSRDDLGDRVALRDWLLQRGLEASAPTDADLACAHALRSALRTLARANTSGNPLGSHASAEVTLALAALPIALTAEDGRIALRPEGAGARAGLAAIALVAVEATATGTWERLKACQKASCGWVFYDASRNRSSSWCSMSICGNRVKARRARMRRREVTS